MLENSFLSMIQAREVSIAVQGKMVEQQRTKGKGLLRKNYSFFLFYFPYYGEHRREVFYIGETAFLPCKLVLACLVCSFVAFGI